MRFKRVVKSDVEGQDVKTDCPGEDDTNKTASSITPASSLIRVCNQQINKYIFSHICGIHESLLFSQPSESRTQRSYSPSSNSNNYLSIRQQTSLLVQIDLWSSSFPQLLLNGLYF